NRCIHVQAVLPEPPFRMDISMRAGGDDIRHDLRGLSPYGDSEAARCAALRFRGYDEPCPRGLACGRGEPIVDLFHGKGVDWIGRWVSLCPDRRHRGVWHPVPDVDSRNVWRRRCQAILSSWSVAGTPLFALCLL